MTDAAVPTGTPVGADEAQPENGRVYQFKDPRQADGSPGGADDDVDDAFVDPVSREEEGDEDGSGEMTAMRRRLSEMGEQLEAAQQILGALPPEALQNAAQRLRGDPNADSLDVETLLKEELSLFGEQERAMLARMFQKVSKASEESAVRRLAPELRGLKERTSSGVLEQELRSAGLKDPSDREFQRFRDDFAGARRDWFPGLARSNPKAAAEILTTAYRSHRASVGALRHADRKVETVRRGMDSRPGSSSGASPDRNVVRLKRPGTPGGATLQETFEALKSGKKLAFHD